MTDADVKLDSISLYLDESSFFKAPPMSTLLSLNFTKYKPFLVPKEQERLSPSLWYLPEVFRKKLSAFSEHHLNEVAEQDRLCEIVKYNFSSGIQISSKEILRHPLHRVVPKNLLPQPQKPSSDVSSIKTPSWPLIEQKDKKFVSQNLRQVEEIIQELLANIVFSLSKNEIQIFLQSKNQPEMALEIENIIFNSSADLFWRVGFETMQNSLECETKLVAKDKGMLVFFESFALDPGSAKIYIHNWFREWKFLSEVLKQEQKSGFSAEICYDYENHQMPTINLSQENQIKDFITELKKRSIPVKITGETYLVEKNKSEVHFFVLENGEFYFQHFARLKNQKDFIHSGWTELSVEILKILSEGLLYFIKKDPKEILLRSGRRRDHDLRFLKHVGIIQYLTFEFFSLYFEGHLSDGKVVDFSELVESLEPKMRDLFASSLDSVIEKDAHLYEFISKNLSQYLSEYIKFCLQTIQSQELFYFDYGEVILEGAVEKEFRLIYEILKDLAFSSSGEAFKRARSSLLAKICETAGFETSDLRLQKFHLSNWKKDKALGPQVLESLNQLRMSDFKFYYKGQSVVELQDEGFTADFEVEMSSDSRDLNWFELNPRFFLLGMEVKGEDLKSFGSGGVLEYQGKIYLVPKKQMTSLKKLENFWLKLQKGKVEKKKKGISENFFQLPRHQILELLSLRASGFKVNGGKDWQDICYFYDNLGHSAESVQVPNSLHADLKPYQKKGYQWLTDLYNLKLGALLADDMGLGKTLQTLTFLESLRQKKQLGHSLIIVPSSLTYNWIVEIQKFASQIPVLVFSNKEKSNIVKQLEDNRDVVIIVTYGLLLEHEVFFNDYLWKVIVFDEAQNLKNITAKRTHVARSLKGQFKICLTGTPMENHYGEFYSLVDLLVPGSLGSMEDFRRQYMLNDIVSKEDIEDLKLKIKPLMLRRSKKEILDQLPEKQETKVSIDFEESQKEIYRDIALSYNQKVQDAMISGGEARVQLQMLTALLRLRQACSDPAALPQVKYNKVPPKLEALKDSLHEIVESGESALVFTQFLQTLEHTVKLLKEEKIPVFALYGGVPAKQRQKILTDFSNAPGGAVLVMTLKTGGVGLNLTKASYVFHLEPWWNPAVENQATDRAHRLGQNRAVQVFKYIMHESLEEKIELLKSRKDRKFQTLLDTSEYEKQSDLHLEEGGSGLSKEDFDFLLKLET